MSEVVPVNEGPYLVCKPLCGHSIGSAYTTITKGKCFDCNKPVELVSVLVSYDAHKLTFSGNCPACGRRHTFLEATVTTLKCEPSSNPEPT